MTTATCRSRVPAAHPSLPGHFAGAPIVPAAWQLVIVERFFRERMGRGRRIVGIATARFRAPWLPDVEVTVTLRESAADRVHFAVDAPDGRIADGVLVVAGTPE
jgi:3-hydroxymyristoyl/3-hydroxydecanoyl-(acyl carrier protein) dehydratase